MNVAISQTIYINGLRYCSIHGMSSFVGVCKVFIQFDQSIYSDFQQIHYSLIDGLIKEIFAFAFGG